MTQTSALGFWLRYAQQRGALHEDAGEKSTVLLPDRLKNELGLPEELVVTGDADVAREDGALLLIPGHPLIDRAAREVLEEADVAVRHLPWPRTLPPAGDELLSRAREQVGVDHGRIDLDPPEIPAWLPLLRVGSLITYLLHDRFQEREEVWVDGASGLLLPEPIRSRIESAQQLTGSDRDLAVLRPDLKRALTEAHAALEARVLVRRRELALETEESLREELARAEAYYVATLAGIAQRQESASAERRELLASQAAATGEERERRHREIEEKFQVRHDQHPFRLHLVLAPAVHLPVTVRRGDRRYPFALTWLLPAAGFLPVRCPSCGQVEPLVAGKERLGCRGCLSTAPASEPTTTRTPPSSHSGAKAPAATAISPTSTEPGGHRRSGSLPATQPPPRGGRRLPKTIPLPGSRRSQDDFIRDYRELADRVSRVGPKFGTDFWQAVAWVDRWPRKRAVPDSPLSMLYRLYGDIAPLRAAGFPPGQFPESISSQAVPPAPDGPHVTVGWLETEKDRHPYTLRWRFQAGKPAPLEVLPGHHPGEASLGHLPLDLLPDHGRCLFDDLPSPRIELDPVAERIWTVEKSGAGLPFMVRCLALWPRTHRTTRSASSPSALAAALATVVGRSSGVRRTKAELADAYATSPSEITRALEEVEKILLSSPPPW